MVSLHRNEALTKRVCLTTYMYYCCFEVGPDKVDQAIVKVPILLPQPPELYN